MKYTRFLAPAAFAIATAAATVPASAQTFYQSDSARAAGQTGFRSVDASPSTCIRDSFGFCVSSDQVQRGTIPPAPIPQAQPQVRYVPDATDAYTQMVNACGGRMWSDRWGQQVDQRIRGALGANGTYSSIGSPYGNFRARQEAICNSRQQMYNLAVRFNGLENVPADQLRAAERAIYVAEVLGPQREAQRNVGQVFRRQQENWADRIFRPR